MSHWVSQPRQLEALAERLDTAPIALDTEFIRERTYYPRLALVQLRAPNDDEHLIDPLALPEAGALAPALQGTAIKIMHSPSEDMQAFLCGWNLVVEPVFDTQLAAAMVGLGAGLSYQALVEKLLGIHLEKGETRSDWLQRPLTESQRHYAAEDVRHLHALHEILDRRLTDLGRRDWLTQDGARLIAATRDDAIDPNPHLTARSAQRMERDAQIRLRRLLLWREAIARNRDKPRSWILDNEVVALLAHRIPDRTAFDTLIDSNPRSPRRMRDELWETLSSPLTEEEHAIPLASAAPDPTQRKILKAMQACVAEHAAALDLPEGLLCARRHLETLLSTRRWPEALEGWRADILQQDLMRLLP
ncbi:ribonuclease D [Xanthomonadaceae bacterium JHOS43]|nr:ribonuclease D [Xanthomonadaceae bacterium JHOS43]MCX7563932.1 ribonuclease D [Xanthomonadaceae bacterium XH05]